MKFRADIYDTPEERQEAYERYTDYCDQQADSWRDERAEERQAVKEESEGIEK